MNFHFILPSAPCLAVSQIIIHVAHAQSAHLYDMVWEHVFGTCFGMRLSPCVPAVRVSCIT